MTFAGNLSKLRVRVSDAPYPRLLTLRLRAFFALTLAPIGRSLRNRP
jgi:hypothetical protein